MSARVHVRKTGIESQQPLIRRGHTAHRRENRLGATRALVLDADGGLAEQNRAGTGEGPLDV